ncbi:hypothetical protein [Parvularcula sp. LCG005]|uniref:hypothetical protein n=1 Tax=Parvularcula sp. LCG005 TaxID=3078805 RepID=UPI002942998C|nr:hypothetical protein [Parvularcula sp. LCG005]WOI54279.1 hypothetical protein RUI03_04585 [Parvularcula sp. LCG005]
MTQVKPFDFTADANLPSDLAAKMQAVADKRAAKGLISADGKTHPNPEALDVYNAGHKTHSDVYLTAAYGKA